MKTVIEVYYVETPTVRRFFSTRSMARSFVALTAARLSLGEHDFVLVEHKVDEL